MKRRRKLSEKAAELQAERGRKVSVKKPGSSSKLGKGEGPKGSSPVPTKLFVSNGSGGGGGQSSVTPKMKPREPAEDSQGYTEDEVRYSYPSSFFTLPPLRSEVSDIKNAFVFRSIRFRRKA